MSDVIHEAGTKVLPTDPFGIVLNKYNKILPFQLINIKAYAFWHTPVHERKNVWNTFNLPVDQLEKLYGVIVQERNKLAREQGLPSFIEKSLAYHSIPEKSFETFRKESAKIVEYCLENLPELRQMPDRYYEAEIMPCVMCLKKGFPFASLEEVRKAIEEMYPQVKQLGDRVVIKTDEYSHMRYDAETKIYEIAIDPSQNIRHQAVDLIHEFGHVISYLKDFETGINPQEGYGYVNEKKAALVASEILRNISAELYRVHLIEILLTIRRAWFEIAIHEDPTVNPGEEYARSFNKCFPMAAQNKNDLYLLDENLVMKPFRSLPHAVVEVENLL